MTFQSLGFLVLASTMGLVSTRSSGAAQFLRRTGADHISIEADSVSLSSFFEALREIVPIEVLILSPEAEKARVSLTVRDVHPVLGVRKFLEKADIDYAVSGGDHGEPFRIIVGQVEGVARASGRQRGPEDEPDSRDADYDRQLELGTEPELGSGASEYNAAQTGRRPVSGMAGRPAPGRRYVTGLARPAAPPVQAQRYVTGSARPAPPGGFVPGVSPPIPPERGERNPLSPAGRPGGASPGPSGPRTISGGAFVTDDASLNGPPAGGGVIRVGALLTMGLLLGIVLVGGPSERSWRRPFV